MKHDHSHKHSHKHLTHAVQSQRLFWAIVINGLLTVVQLVGGVLSGSLSLVSDAIHNFSDAGALLVAYVARRLSGLPATSKLTFGYGRAEILGALINGLTLLIVGLYLIYEAAIRMQNPRPIEGGTVIWVASVALVIDLATAYLTHEGAKDNVNFRAAFVHNVADALASVVVIISGTLILFYQVYWVDLAATLLISAYIIKESLGIVKSCILVLMQAVPEDMDVENIKERIRQCPHVVDIHHVHLWQIHEDFRSFEAHIVVDTAHYPLMDQIKKEVKQVLSGHFHITHSTLEFESPEESTNHRPDDPHSH